MALWHFWLSVSTWNEQPLAADKTTFANKTTFFKYIAVPKEENGSSLISVTIVVSLTVATNWQCFELCDDETCMGSKQKFETAI